MFKDFSNHELIHKSFTWIKQNLDPARSYIIFENDLNKHPDSIFQDSLMVYQYLTKGGYAWRKVCDTRGIKEYLVIEIDPGNEDETLGRVMGYGLPKDTVYYLYKAGA
jgi:hypothetical protein